MGVITYFLLCGYTPFDRENQQEEAAAICRGDYKFEPVEYWANVSDTAKSFVTSCLTIDQHKRPTAAEALKHPWLASAKPYFVVDPQSSTGQPADLLPQFQKAFNARKTCESQSSLDVRLFGCQGVSSLLHYGSPSSPLVSCRAWLARRDACPILG